MWAQVLHEHKPADDNPLRPEQVEMPAPQAHLIAACLKVPLQQSLSAAAFAAISSGLDVLADRIARNRELAGLHYPSDTAAGVALAGEMMQLLQNLATFQAAVTIAQNEWANVK